MVHITFNIREVDMVATLSPASRAMLDGLPPITHADLARDMLIDAQEEYNRARKRCDFEPIELTAL